MSNFIDERYVIDFPVPTVLQDFIDAAEQADRDNSLGLYLVYADQIDTVAKNCYGDGAITQEMWDILCCRYAQ